ncbi:MAG: MFS transporter, partial [Armatimonadetes bacterium]|nr:MFS transporter [Armatimonadota bacterium]
MASPSRIDPQRLPAGDPQKVTRAARMRGIRLVFVSNAIVAVFSNITAGTVATGYALFLGATNYHIGLLSSVPTFVQAMQAVAPVFTERYKHRKPVHCAFNLISYLVWIPIALIPFYVPALLRPWAMIALVGASGMVGGYGTPAGASWITDLIPPDMLGWFYARVNTILTVVGMVTALVAGRYIDLTPHRFGFPSVFLFAVATAGIANMLLRFVPEPDKKEGEVRGIAETFALPFRDRNFRNLMIFFAVRSMAVMVAAPFFSVYWIKHLKLSYSYIALISAIMSLSMIASYQLWGYLSDKYGNKPVTKICWTGMCFIPITWFFVTRENYLYGAPLAALWGGFFSSGVGISQLNLRAKIAPEENRSVYLGCFNGVVSATAALGPILGGSLATLLKDVDFMLLGVHVETLKSLFLISASLRLACSPLLWLVEEEKEMPAQFLLRQMPARNP